MLIFSWCLTSWRVFSEWLIPEPGESYLPQIPAVPTPNPSATNKSEQVSLIWNFLTTLMGLVRLWIFAGAHDLSDPYMNVFVTKLQIFASHRSAWSDQGAAQEIQWWPHPHPCRLTAQGRLTWYLMIFVNDVCLIWWYLLMIFVSYGDILKPFFADHILTTCISWLATKGKFTSLSLHKGKYCHKDINCLLAQG